jgi:hypothetical protein
MVVKPPIHETLARIRAEYVDMPGLNLTRAQAQRLFHVDSHTCDELLRALVDAGFCAARVKGCSCVAAAARPFVSASGSAPLPDGWPSDLADLHVMLVGKADRIHV